MGKENLARSHRPLSVWFVQHGASRRPVPAVRLCGSFAGYARLLPERGQLYGLARGHGGWHRYGERILQQPWSNGQVFQIGASADGIAAFELAKTADANVR